MATKANPGKFDCYAKAGDDEPIFVLRAKDPVAQYLVAAWVSLRTGRSLDHITRLMEDAIYELRRSGRTLLPDLSEKAIEAEQCSKQMRTWYNNQLVLKAQERLENG